MSRKKRKHRGDVDGLGKPAPVYLADVFEGRSYLYGLASDIENLSNALARHADGQYARHVNVGQVQELLHLAAESIRLDAPLTACDCPAGELDCPKCEGTRWVSSRTYQTISRPAPT